MRVRLLSTLVAVCAMLCLLALAGCAGSTDPKPKEAVRLDLTLSATSTVNPDEQRRAAPIVVRIYELKNDTAFRTADFFTLQNQEKAAVGDDVIKRDEFLLRPGEHQHIIHRMDAATTSLGIIAAYRDLPNSVWRATWPVVAPDVAWYRMFAPKLKLAVTLDTHAIQIAGPKK